MPHLAKRSIPFAIVVLVSAWLAAGAGTMGDWSSDARPAVEALASGHFGAYFEEKAMMGPFATLAQAPLVALSGSHDLDAYRWASFPCLLAAGLLGLYLASIARRRGASTLVQAVLALVCLLNPLTFEALDNGHPEEILTAALAVAAIASAAEGKRRQTALLLGLAVASKQWAVIAVLPALLALPSGRARAALTAAGVAALLMLPGFLAAPDSFLGVQGEAAGTGRVVTPWSAWYPISETTTQTYEVGDRKLSAERREAPAPASPLSHPLIVLLALLLPLALALRRGLPLAGEEAMALLALLALLRCWLDPVDNLYYHEPLLLALVGWDAFATRRAPLRSLAGVAIAFWLWSSWHDLSDPAAFNLAYLGVALTATIAIASSVFARSSGRAFNQSKFSLQADPISGIK